MNAPTSLKIVLFTGIAGLLGAAAGARMPDPGPYSFVSNAEARIGRPLTPVSVAGVARRTARRCMVGVYRC